MPSPLQFDIIDSQSRQRKGVNGYCNRRKDSLAIFKDADGDWHIIHKASGFSLNEVRRSDVKKYPALLALCAHLQSECASQLAAIDQLPFNPTNERKAALRSELDIIRSVGLKFNG